MAYSQPVQIVQTVQTVRHRTENSEKSLLPRGRGGGKRRGFERLERFEQLELAVVGICCSRPDRFVPRLLSINNRG